MENETQEPIHHIQPTFLEYVNSSQTYILFRTKVLTFDDDHVKMQVSNYRFGDDSVNLFLKEA